MQPRATTRHRAVCREAIRLLEKTGDRWEGNTAGWHVAMCLARTGRLGEAAEVAAEVLGAARAIGDSASTGIALSVLARTRAVAVDAASVDAELARGSDDAHTLSELRLAAALCARRDGDLVAAANHLRAAVTEHPPARAAPGVRGARACVARHGPA